MLPHKGCRRSVVRCHAEQLAIGSEVPGGQYGDVHALVAQHAMAMSAMPAAHHCHARWSLAPRTQISPAPDACGGNHNSASTKACRPALSCLNMDGLNLPPQAWLYRLRRLQPGEQVAACFNAWPCRAPPQARRSIPLARLRLQRHRAAAPRHCLPSHVSRWAGSQSGWTPARSINSYPYAIRLHCQRGASRPQR